MEFFVCLCFLVVSSTVQSQQVVTGRITDASDGQPIVGANIYVVNTTISTSSDFQTTYSVVIKGIFSDGKN